MKRVTVTSSQYPAFIRRVQELALVFASLTCALSGWSASPAAGPASNDMDQILTDLETFAVREMQAAKIPGMAYAVVHDGEIVYSKGFGKTFLHGDRDVEDRTLFEIGSTTKAFNAVLLGTLVDEGKVRWTDKVADLEPKFKMYESFATKEFQVRDLLAQRSGMPGYALDLMSMVGFGREDIMRAIRHVEPTSSFRSEYGYQNNLHLWVADLVEKKTGLTWEEAMKRRLLGPMGMADSTLDAAANDANPDHAMGHLWDGSNLQVIPSDWPYRPWLAIYAPAGGLYSSARDMARRLLFQLGEGTFQGTKVFSTEVAQAMREPRIFLMSVPPATTLLYCSGWLYQTTSPSSYWWHNGQTMGMHSAVAFYPEGRLGLVVLTNEPNNKVPERMMVELHRLYFGSASMAGLAEDMAALADGPKRASSTRLPESTAARPPGHYTGAYSNPAYGKAVVKKEGEALKLSLGPDRVTGPLVPTGGDTFRFEFPQWPGNVKKVEFKGAASGKAAGLILEGMEDVRGGEFRRVGD